MDPNQRVQELEVAIATALKLNSTLHSEIEAHFLSSSGLETEKEAWKLNACKLVHRINAIKKALSPDAALGYLIRGDLTQEEARKLDDENADRDAAFLVSFLAQQEAEAESASLTPLAPMPFAPTEKQEQAITSLLHRGHAAGWLINPSDVTLGKELGSGSFGTTFKAIYQGSHVACKCVRISKPSELTTFLREVESLSLLKSPHIVPFLGASLQAPNHFYILTEYMAGGTLDQWLAAKPGSSTRRSLADRAQMCLDVARGMVAMHSCSPAIYHRDLKPSNILIDGAGRARIGDMGFSRRLMTNERQAQLTGETGTYLYMSPEMMRHEVYDQSTDVWSWGVLFSELMNGTGPPYHHLFLTSVQIGLAVAQEQLSPSFPETLPIEMQVLGRMATQFDPRTRPSFSDLVSDLTPVVEVMVEEAKSSSAHSPSSKDSLLSDRVASFSLNWGSVMGRTIYKQPGETVGISSKSRPSTAASTRPSIAEVEARVRALTLSRAPKGRVKADMLDSAYALAAKIAKEN
jgi:serine/threonine protein kinase